MITIRDATLEDAPLLLNAERKIAESPGFLVSQAEELLLENYLQRLRLSTQGIGKYIVITDAHQIIGHANLSPMPLSNHAHIVRLDICVYAEHRKQGHGRAMLEHLIDWCQAVPHICKIELLVRETNLPAIALYESLGFIVEGRLNDRVRISASTFIADLSMAKFL